MNMLEIELCNIYNSKFCCFTGNGTTAMYLLFMALKGKNKKVLYPAISCTNPVNSCIYAGYTPEFCDVNLVNYTMDINMMEEKLKTNEFGIVVPTHIYGHKYDRKRIREICNKYNVFLLEDSAQTVDIGMSDASIVSFGHTKIFESEFGGGAIFLNDEELYKRINEVKINLKRKPQNSKDLFDDYRKKYYSIVKLSKTENEKNKKLLELQLESKGIFIYDMEENKNIINIIKDRQSIEKSRIKKAKIYSEKLNKSYIKSPNVDYKSEIIWRYTFLVDKNREKFLEKVRENKIDISSWYPSLSKIYKNEVLKNADYIEKNIVNLWVDSSHSEEKIYSDIYILNNILEEINDGK